MSKNDTSSTRTKYMDIQYHFVKDSFSKNMLSIDYSAIENIAADLLTNQLQRVLLQKFKTKLGLQEKIKLIEHVTEGKCLHRDFRDAMSDICHNSLKASIRATFDSLIEFSTFELVGNDCKIPSYSSRLLSASTSLFCKHTDSLMHV